MSQALVRFLWWVVIFAILPVARAQVAGPRGHYYKVVLDSGLLWEEAKARAAESVFNGVHGYLATITSAEEDQFIEDLRVEAAPGGDGSLWVGGFQESAMGLLSTDSWYWLNGEGPIPTLAGADGYSNWQQGEPNDLSGPQLENYMSVGHFNHFGWNDEPDDRHVMGYVVEYPSAGTTSTVKVAAVDPVATENPTQTTEPSPSPVDSATFVFWRDGDLALDLPVFYSIHGTAVNGIDYNEIAKSIIIPAGKSEVRLEIVPRVDVLTVVEQMETVGIRVEPSLILTPTSAYKMDEGARQAAAVIYESQPPKRASLEIAVPRNGFTYSVGDPVTIIAAIYSTQAVTTVNFYADNQLIGSASDAEHPTGLRFLKFTWTNPPPGTPTLVARAALAIDNPPSSSPVKITIPATAEPPVVGIRFVAPTTTEPLPDADYAPGYLEVTRTGSTAANLEVIYGVTGTATAGVDYEALQAYVVIAAGKSAARITVVAKDDLSDESNETVILTLLPPPPGTAQGDPIVYNIDPDHSSAEVIILDNDEPEFPMVKIVAAVDQTLESGAGGSGRFRISRTGPTGESLTVRMQYSGSATPDVDYHLLPANILIPAGADGVDLFVEPVDDQIVEGDETVIASFAPFRGVLYNVNPDYKSATVVIIDQEPTPSETIVRIEAVDPAAIEGQPVGGPAPNPAVFRVARTGSTTGSLQVFYSLHGTAKNGEDYELISETAMIEAGRTSVDIQIVPKSDTPSIGHRYEIVQESGLTWAQAREKARQKTYLSVIGHLATITSAEEDAKIESLRLNAGGPVLWVGGFQDPAEMSITEGWKWDNDEGPIPGTNSSAPYANWLPSEPNDYWGPGSENGMVIGWLGSFGWNDQGLNVGAGGYVIEYDVDEPEAGAREMMETVGIRIEPSPAVSPLPTYAIDPKNRSAAAVIFDGQPPMDGALEVAIPSSGDVYQANDVEFVVAGFHPTIDVLAVDFYVDDVKVGDSVFIFDRTISGGVLEHHFKWTTPLNGQHILQAKATLDGGRVLTSSRVPFTVTGAANVNPVVKITKPEDGATFIEGDFVEIAAESDDPDGTTLKIELLMDGNVIASANGESIHYTLNNARVGAHTLVARAGDNDGGVGSSPAIHFLVRHPDAVAFVHRELPAGYSPGVSFLVELRADPPEGTFAYAIEDRPPTGWRVTDINEEGAFDSATGKVKFGPFIDDGARVLRYRVTPPENASGTYEFTGSSSVNGAIYPITGDTTVQTAQQNHPGDSNQDFKIILSEVTAYAAAWKSGQPWPTGPVPIPLSYVTRAHHLWQRGEAYRFDPAAGAAPSCWVPLITAQRVAAMSFADGLIGAAQRSVFGNLNSGAGTQVQITTAPPAGASGYAVEEKPPHGWMISNISHEGTLDPLTGTIRWGVFADATTRTLAYTATPPPTVTSIGVFAGQLSYDGKLMEIGADERVANSVIVDGVAPIRINNWQRDGGTMTLDISGPAGQTAVIESSNDFTSWTEVKSIFIPNGSVSVTYDSAGTESRLFYRLRVQ